MAFLARAAKVVATMALFAAAAGAQSAPGNVRAPLPRFTGEFKRMDDKLIALGAEGGEMEFRRTGRTRFFKDGKSIKASEFKAGDRISIEGEQDMAGRLNAINVYWERPLPPNETVAPGSVDAWSEDAPASPSEPEPAAAGDAAAPQQPSVSQPAPASGAATVREEPKPEPRPAIARPGTEVRATPDLSSLDPEKDLALAAAESDPAIRKAADAALEYIGDLPDYVCQEVISRFQSASSAGTMRRIDVVTADVVYERGKENYRNVAVNGASSAKSLDEAGGAWSTGEFGTMLIDLFNPATAARFHFRKVERVGGTETRAYTFEVAQENSHWDVRIGAETFTVAYKGTVWIEPATGRVFRIEKDASGRSGGFPFDSVQSKVEYGYVRLGNSNPYLLPVSAEMQGCQPHGAECYQNTIQFRNYRKFESESLIRYGEGK